MSITALIADRNKDTGPLVLYLMSFVEMVLFFCVVTPLLAWFLPVLLVLTTQAIWGANAAGSAVLWSAVIASVLYIALIVFYWIPGDKETSKAELRAFATFMGIAAVACGIYLESAHGHIVSQTVRAIFTGP